ncbi:MAG: DUF4926 domain-containing protein [Opitutaceae bacterium]
MKFKLYSDVALAHDLPKHQLRRGDIVRLVEHHLSREGEEGYSAEVISAKVQTLAVIAVAASSLEVRWTPSTSSCQHLWHVTSRLVEKTRCAFSISAWKRPLIVQFGTTPCPKTDKMVVTKDEDFRTCWSRPARGKWSGFGSAIVGIRN